MGAVVLEDLLEPDHQARVVWAVVCSLDLSAFTDKIEARGESPGRAATDPALLVALWLYAYTQGVGGGRELDRLCECQDAYRWLCGGVSLNYHTLTDFRVKHKEALQGLFTQVVIRLVQKGVVKVTRISQDGTRVRASAGSSSFRRESTLVELQKEAKAHLQALETQGDPAWSGRQAAAQRRAAQEQVEQISQALEQMPEIRETQEAYGNRKKHQEQKKREPRASTSDPQARVMKMPDGGFRPAYNVQIASDTASRAVLAVEVTHVGSDRQESQKLREKVEACTGRKVEEHLMDGGYVHLESIEAAGPEVKIYAPRPEVEGVDPSKPKKGDGPAVAAWRERMGEPQAQTIYKERAALSETINADLKTHRGLGPFLVRGLEKVTCVALLCGLAYNLKIFAGQLLA
jgi:transposase